MSEFIKLTIRQGSLSAINGSEKTEEQKHEEYVRRLTQGDYEEEESGLNILKFNVEYEEFVGYIRPEEITKIVGTSSGTEITTADSSTELVRESVEEVHALVTGYASYKVS